MRSIAHDAPLVMSVAEAIQLGRTDSLRRLLSAHPELVHVRVRDVDGNLRSLLHIATDWPGHFPGVAETIRILIGAGADPDARFEGAHSETPLHWAASSNDVRAIDALLDGGADLAVHGAVIAGGDPLQDAIGFENWEAARRLVERGARTSLGDESALGLMSRIRRRFEGGEPPASGSIDYAFWVACCAGQLRAAQYLLVRDADINWLPGWCDETALDAALRNGDRVTAGWLRSEGALRRTDLDADGSG